MEAAKASLELTSQNTAGTFYFRGEGGAKTVGAKTIRGGKSMMNVNEGYEDELSANIPPTPQPLMQQKNLFSRILVPK